MLFHAKDAILGIGFQATDNNERWKTILGEGATAINLCTLANPPPRHRAFASSFLIQSLCVAFLIALPMWLPQTLDPFRRHEIVPLVAPPTLPLRPPEILVKGRRPAQPKVAKLIAPPNEVFEGVRPAAPKLARPRAVVQTGMFSVANFAAPSVHKNTRQVQTGGFGDPHGLPGSGNPNKRANIARKGSWGLPVGAGFGNGIGGGSGVPGTVSGNAPGAAPGMEPVEILMKPQPVYTEEARRLRLEGEVVLRVIFRASGRVQVIRVVRALGHGLDQAAVFAAQQIRFKPARRHATPVDFPASIRIIFQLAY